MLKRLYFLLSIILIVGLVLGIGWFIRYRSSVVSQNPGNPNSSSSSSINLPTVPSRTSSGTPETVSLPPQKPFGPVADQEVIAYYPYPDGSVIIIQPGGQVMKIAGTEGVVLSSLAISNLSHAAFSYDGKKIVALFGNPLNLQVSVFDIDRKSWEPVFARPTSLPLWSLNDYRLLFLTDSEGNQTITTINMGASAPKAESILTVNGYNTIIGWKGVEEIFITEKPSAFSISQLLAYDLKKKTMTTVLRDRAGLTVLWNPTVQEGVIFEANKNSTGGKMSLISGVGVVARQFSFTSLPNKKCVFENTIAQVNGTSTTSLLDQPSRLLICSVPRSGGGFLAAFLPDDYLQKDIMTEDYILEADLSTGSVKDLSKNITESFDGISLKATAESVFFINRYNNKLYRLTRS